jgi:DNA-binding SARP family transcriptional activator/tetratricopeptide (TPR) repeat protein
LLALLATEPDRPHRRETLAGSLWPGSPERTARTNLRQALANLRRALGDDRHSDLPLFRISRQTIQLDTSAGVFVDVPCFLSLLEAGRSTGRAPVPQLVEAVELYRGSFLEGFSIADSPEFEEWALLTRERLHRLAMDALHRLARHYLQRGQYQRALPYAWRQVELDPWREEAHQQVMRMLAYSGRRGAALAQYETCRRVLAQELAVEPAAETTRLYEQIRDGTLEAPPPPPAPEAFLPGFLERDAADQPGPVFVAREKELARLDAYLEAALAGQGQVVFVTGGPGRGKTALLGEFVRRAMDAHSDLLVALGKCNALSGAGDPYLPFREMLSMLMGDVEARWAAGSIGRDHARRLWAALPIAAQALAERGPYITGILIDGPTLLSRAEVATELQVAPWLTRLREQVEHQRAHTKGLEQSHLFEQVTNVLCCLARTHPLLLIIDDLQWADVASTGLLFHLGRRLQGHPILLAAAYRPEEVVFGRDGAGPVKDEDHPLDKVLAELKEQFGDVWVDLARSDPSQDRAFIDAFLDSEPNRLDEGFRGALFARTLGHPLFTVELLRAMQERQDLLRDDEERWIEGPALHWETLPARVEGAIEQRIGRLSPELRDILAVASVEGEEFTAQVVARVQGHEERQLLHLLSEDLERKHRLVRARNEIRAGSRHLSRYRFGHVLFRDHLYGSLSPGERRLLHREVGTALEELCGDKVGEIAASLADHFSGDAEKERYYARLAGERAASQYANEEAVRHLSRALELTAETEITERFDLLLARERVYDRQADREAILRDLEALESLAALLGDPRKQAEVELQKGDNAFDMGEHQQGIEFAKAAARLSRSAVDRDLEAQAHLKWGVQVFHLGEYDSARQLFAQGLALAREGDARWLEAEILRWLWYANSMVGDEAQAEACIVESQRIFQEVGDRFDEMRIQFALAFTRGAKFEHQQSRDHVEAAVQLAVELGDRGTELRSLHNLACVLQDCGDYETASAHHERVLHMSQEAGIPAMEARSLLDLGWQAHWTGDSEKGLALVRQALTLAREISERPLLLAALNRLGRILGALGCYEEGRAACEEALELARETGYAPWVMDALAGLALVLLGAGETAQAIGHVDEILAYLQSGTPEGWIEEPFQVYLSCYRVLRVAGDPRAVGVLEEGYQFLQEIANKMTDEDLRRSFLENVAWHRELTQEYARVRG